MSFTKTNDGRVFFQNSNNNDQHDGDQQNMTAEPTDMPADIEKSIDTKTSQLQVLALLRSLNDRLKTTQDERDQFRQDLEDYRKMVETLGQRSEKSDQAFMMLEDKLENHEKSSHKALKDAQSKAEEAFKELEEARAQLIQLEEKAAGTEKRLRDQILKRGTEEQDFKSHYESLREEQEALKKALQEPQNNNALIKKTEELNAKLEEKIDETISKAAQMERKLEKSVQERNRMMRKMERLEESVIQTHDALNAKALVLLTDQSVAGNINAPQISASPEVDADKSNVKALSGAQAQPALENDESYDDRPLWVRLPLFRAGLLGLLFIAGVLIGWGITQLTANQSPSVQTPAQNDEALSLSSYEPFYSDDVGLSDFNAQDAIANAVLDAPQSIPVLPETDAGRLELLESDPAALGAALNAIEPSSINDDENGDAPGAVENPTISPDAALQAVQEPSVQSVQQRIKSDDSLPETIKEIETQAFNGVAEAQHDLAAIYTAGHAGVDQNYERAAIWFREAAENGVANARYNLGVLNHQGIGINQDMTQAIYWYRQAADLGHPEAQYNLGIAYVEGVGVDYDPAQAANYFREAADQNILEAAYNLGLIYENGLLGLPEPDLALAWYKKAADLGSPEAAAALEQLANNLGRDVSDINRIAEQVNLSESIRSESGNNAALDYQRQVTAKIQSRLIDVGLYPGPADGINGQQTQDAIRSYQASYDLIVDGRASKNLLNHMLIHLDEG